MVVLTGLFAVSVSNINLKWRIMDVQLLTYLVMFVFGGFMVSSHTSICVPDNWDGRTEFLDTPSSPIKESRIFIIKFILGFVLVLPIAEYIAITSNIPFINRTELRSVLLWFGVFNAFWISLYNGFMQSWIWRLLCELS